MWGPIEILAACWLNGDRSQSEMMGSDGGCGEDNWGFLQVGISVAYRSRAISGGFVANLACGAERHTGFTFSHGGSRLTPLTEEDGEDSLRPWNTGNGGLVGPH
jgi:hypothetical protein